MGRPEYPGNVHEYEKPVYPQDPLASPSNPLEWGDFNVIHTTDIHGWLLGHQKPSLAEPYYSGDLGDFASFVSHMKDTANAKGVDLLLIDTGDIFDGTGLSDGTNAYESNEFLKRLPYDLMTIGNHDLNTDEKANYIHKNLAPHLNGRYLTSNVDITVKNLQDESEPVPVGNRYYKFKTRKGYSITSLGILLDMKDGGSIHVKSTKDMIKEQWFKEAIKEEADAFILIGHMPVSDDNWKKITDEVWAAQPGKPILIFGGHTHIRDCKTYAKGPNDPIRSVALQSGHYMDTIGWMSVNLADAITTEGPLQFSRRYLDQNRVTYQYHTKTSYATFDTLQGLSISGGLQKLATRSNLFSSYGTAPRDYTLNQSHFQSEGSLHSFYIETAVPYALDIDNTRKSIPRIIISNANALRFDLFKGSFTKDDEISVMMYPDEFRYIPGVPFNEASKVLGYLNKDTGKQLKCDEGGLGDLPVGYVTTDSCPGYGDDTTHTKLPNCPFPDYISSTPPALGPDDKTPIDLVFIDHLGNRIIDALADLHTQKTYTKADIEPYSKTLTDEVLGIYARNNWN
ncbi:Metallo-dependent phosphatase-like protein [Suillus spraguei]|nr:Metallo-dependent phosphatase-like protein [Suillus spraguei]